AMARDRGEMRRSSAATSDGQMDHGQVRKPRISRQKPVTWPDTAFGHLTGHHLLPEAGSRLPYRRESASISQRSYGLPVLSADVSRTTFLKLPKSFLPWSVLAVESKSSWSLWVAALASATFWAASVAGRPVKALTSLLAPR